MVIVGQPVEIIDDDIDIRGRKKERERGERERDGGGGGRKGGRERHTRTTYGKGRYMEPLQMYSRCCQLKNSAQTKLDCFQESLLSNYSPPS